MYDLLIRGARIIDGTGADAFCTDIAVKDGKIVMNPSDNAAEVIDATGLTLCPGFIDAHSHGDHPARLGSESGQLSKTNQGITTELAGQCGTTRFPFSSDPDKRELLHQKVGRSCFPHETLESYLEWVHSKPKTTNIALYIGHSAVRISAMGFDMRKPTAEELQTMKDMVREAMEHGAMGMSSGLIYAPSCFADEEELVELCRVVAEYGGTYATHMRNEAGAVLDSVCEAIRVAERAGCKLNISHHKVSGKDNWGMSKETLNLVHEAQARGVDVTLDVYPYTASSTALNICLPMDFFSHGPEGMCRLLADPAVRAELKPRMLTVDGRLRHCGGWTGVLVTSASKTPDAVGLTVQEYADKLGRDPFEVYFDLVQVNGGSAQAVYFSMCEEDLERIVCDENAVIGTDGVNSHPRAFGSFPRAFRHFVRDKKLLTQEQMIHKMTGLTAKRFGLTGKGIIADGMDADLVLFRADELTDCATYQNAQALCKGIERVFVAGKTVYKDGKLTGECPGKFLPRGN